MTDNTEELVRDLEAVPLKDADASAIRGGADNTKAEAQVFQSLGTAVNELMKNFGGALNTAARAG